MKNGRKILSIILTICMVMQILPVFATEGEAQAPAGGAGGSGINYLINDDFGAQTETDKTTGLDGWTLVGDNGFTEIPSDTVTTEKIEGEEGNYALKYVVNASTWKNTHISKALETPAAFVDETDVVIETRVMQDNGNVYDAETGKLTTDEQGRSFLKYNFAAVEGDAEYNFDWGTLVRNSDGTLAGAAGWTMKNAENVGYYYEYVTPSSLGTVDAKEWYTIKVIIHGTTNGTANTADYVITADDGTVIGKTAKSVDINFPENSKWYFNGTTYIDPAKVQAAWVENALNTVDFRQRNANTLYVDYVRVYEVKQEEVRANLVSGRYVQFDENIEVKLTTEAEALTLIEETAKLTTAVGAEVATSVSYDAENKILSVDPTEDLIPGDIYNLTFTDNDFNKFTGTRTFELEARAARSYGMVVNDTFDDLTLGVTDNASGWYLGKVADEAAKGILEIVDSTDEAAVGVKGKALKINGAITGTDGGNALQTYVTRKIGGGIEYTDNNTVVIKTRIKHTTAASRVLLLENRPDSVNLPNNALGFNLYNLVVANETKALNAYNLDQTNNTTTQQGGSKSLDANVVTAGKWMDYELVIKNNGKKMDATVVVENGDETTSTYSLTDLNLNRTMSVYETEYGIGTDVRVFDALERLGFTFRKSNDVLYIDEFKVYEVYTDVKISAGETYKPGEAIDVKFDVPAGDASFLDAVKLYNGETEITAVSKSINEAKNVVTITPDEALAEGAYKVKVDTANIPTEAYNITETTATFHIMDMDKEYLIYDEFGNGDTEGWEMKQYATNDSTIGLKSEGNGNYSLQMTSTDNANAMDTYYTRRLDTPIPFESGKNIVIETKFMQEGGSAGDGRAYFKFNMPTDKQQNGDVNLNWGTLAYMQDKKLYTPSVQSWGATPTETTYMTPLTIDTTDVNNTWYEVKVTINGNTKTAAYEIKDVTHNEVFTNTIKNADIDHFNHASFEEEILNSIDFRLRNANTFYVDYVKVWEYTSSNVRVNTVEGKTFEAGKAIEFKVTAADGATVSNTIVDTVTVSPDATVAYENGILSVTPEAAEGDTVTVTFADNDYVKYVDSTTSFTLTARGERETGVIINDTFDGEDAATTLDGWVAGAMAEGNETKLDVNTYEGRKALRFYTETADVKHTSSVGIQPKIYKKLGDGVEFTGNNKVIIKTAVFQPTTSTGRFDFKFNRPNSTTQITGLNEEQWFNYGLIRHNSNKASVTSSIDDENTNGAYVESTDFKNGSAVLNPMGQWVEYTLVLDGYAKEISATAVDANGVVYTAKGLFDLAAITYEDIYGKGIVTKNNRDNAYVKALESLTFKNTEGNSKPVYIDYIKVYEDSAIVDVDVRSTARYDKGFTIKLDTKSDISELGTVATVDGVVTTQSINNDNKVVTLIPEENLELNQEYTLTLNADVLADAGLLYEGETTFTVKARDNIIFDNQFKTAGELEGWVLGETTVDSSKYEYGVKDDAMYLTLKEGRDDSDTPALYLDFADVDYEEGSTIIIETKIKQTGTTADHRSLLKLNRPNKKSFSGNENGHNWYGLVSLKGTQFDATNTTGHSEMASMFSAADAGVENLANTWVDVKIELDGVNKVAYITATPDGGKSYTATSTLKDDAGALADAGAPETGFTAFDSLTWLFRSKAGENTLYIDYIKAYEKVNASVTIDAAAMPGYDVKIKGNADIGAYITTGDVILENLETYVELYDGENVVDATKTHIEGTNKVVIDPKSDLAAGAYTVKFDKDALAAKGYTLEGDTEFEVEVIAGADVDMSFEGLTAGAFEDTSWAFEESTVTGAATIETENGNNFLRITANGPTAAKVGEVLTYSKTLATPFVRDMKASTVFEAKIRTNSDAMRKQIKLNYPDEGTYNTNVYPDVGLNTRIAAVMDKGNLGVAYIDYRPDDQHQGKPTNVAKYELEQWYTIKTIYHNAEGTASTYVYDEEGTLIGELEDKALTAWWFNYYDYLETQPQVMHSIDDITIRFRPNASGTAANEQFDIDDIKIYNITEVDESATAKFMDGATEVKAITESGNVTPTFEIQSKNNETAEYYIIAAKYEDGRLADTQMKSVTVTGKQTVTLDAIEVDKDNTGLVVKAFVWSKNMVPVCKQAEIKPTVYTIYMATDGDDANEGYASAPVATLNRAIELANVAKTNGYATSEVIIADGNYELTGKTISIGSNLKADSLTVRAENPKGAKFINGVAYKLSEATSAPEDIKNRLSNQNVRDQLYAINLLSNPKVTAADIPQMNLPGSYSYAVMASNAGNKDANGAQIINITEPELAANELFYDGKAMTVARYPNTTYETLTEGSFSFAPNSVTRNWADDYEDKKDEDGNSLYTTPENRVATPFTVTLEQAKKWGGANQALMFGFWYHDWATQTVPVGENGIDTTTGVITSKYPSHYGLKAGGRYYVYNLLEEIDVEGEYFIDRNPNSDTFGMMYFIKPSGEADEIIMSLYGDENNGIIDISASNVTVKDLVFTASRGKAIRAYGNNVIIDNCEISNTGTTAVSLSGKNSVIQNCTIHDVNGGISLGGGNTNTLTPGNNKALNNTITNFSRLNKTYTDAIQVTGMGNVAEGNTISQGEHLAMRISGVQNVIRNNDISHVLKEADDMGAIYAGRSWTSRDNVIEYNYIHELKSTEVGAGDSAIGGIFLDDHFADVTIRGNIFDTIKGHGIRLNQGREHIIENNIFINLEGYSVSGSEGTGLASSYGTQIAGVKALLAYDAWKNHEDYAAELFNETKTDYNPDLLWTRGIKVINNYTGSCAGVAALTDTDNDNGTINKGNGLTNAVLTTKAEITSEVEAKGGTFVFDNMPLSKIGITE